MSNVILDTPAKRVCANCGYDLRGLQNDRCPECGEAFDPNVAPDPPVPWIHRRALGTWPAYWQTVRMSLFHPQKLATDIWSAPRVQPEAALCFRWVLIAQATISVMLAVGMIIWSYPWTSVALMIVRLLGIEFGVALSLSMFFAIATDVVQNDAWQRALNHYTCAPLALVPIAALAGLITSWANGPVISCAIAMSAIILIWWWIDHVLAMHVVKRSLLTSFGNAIFMPIGWIFLAGVAALCGIAAGSLLTVLLSQWL